MLIDTGTKPEKQREVNVDRYRDKTRETKGGKC
jgi:hypothetical protein